MAVTIKDILECLDDIAPFDMAEPWDNIGLLIGDLDREASSLLVGLDPSNRLLDEAIDLGADTVITHHPALFKPLRAIDTSDPSGRFLEKAVSYRLSILACHTNFDSTVDGVNDALAGLLELHNVRPLVPAGEPESGSGIGRLGNYPERISRRRFMALVLNALGLPFVQMAGELPETIGTVGLCGGSGSEYARMARDGGADVYLSAEIKHNIAHWAQECGFCVIDGSHYATEKPAVKLLARRVRDYAAKRDWKIRVWETKTEKPPFMTVDKYSFT